MSLEDKVNDFLTNKYMKITKMACIKSEQCNNAIFKTLAKQNLDGLQVGTMRRSSLNPFSA